MTSGVPNATNVAVSECQAQCKRTLIDVATQLNHVPDDQPGEQSYLLQIFAYIHKYVEVSDW